MCVSGNIFHYLCVCGIVGMGNNPCDLRVKLCSYQGNKKSFLTQRAASCRNNIDVQAEVTERTEQESPLYTKMYVLVEYKPKGG